MKLCVVLVIFILFTFLFYKAAGTLSLAKLNIISFLFYNILIFDFIGASLVFLGFRNHYLISYIISDFIVYKTYIILTYTMIALPLCMCLFIRLLHGRGSKTAYLKYITHKVEYKKTENNVFVISVVLTIIGILATLYVLYYIGYIPLLKIFQPGFNTDVQRVQINRSFTGNPYIKNLLMMLLTPLLSYLSYIYYRLSKKKQWLLLFVIQFIVSVIIKTHDFSKSPLIYYFFYFYIIEVAMGNTRILKKLAILISASVFIIYLQYIYIMGYNASFFTISSGPLGRILMSQVSTLFLHIQSFPAQIPYLGGASFPTVIASLIGAPNSWVRSGREVMKLYNPSGIQAGTAGVMNTIFVGEAYANWGILGAIISPIVVALVFAVVYFFLLKCKKTPLSILIYVALFSSYTEALQGGFVEFLYSATVIVLISLLFLMIIMEHRGNLKFIKPLKWKRKL